MLQNVNKSMESQDLQRKEFEATIKAFDAETKRISAVQASMTPEQIQDIIMGTIHGAITSGDLVGAMPNREMSDMNEPMPEQMPLQEMPQEMSQEMLSQGMPPQGMPQ
jgi:hypothetical protein